MGTQGHLEGSLDNRPALETHCRSIWDTLRILGIPGRYLDTLGGYLEPELDDLETLWGSIWSCLENFGTRQGVLQDIFGALLLIVQHLETHFRGTWDTLGTLFGSLGTSSGTWRPL